MIIFHEMLPVIIFLLFLSLSSISLVYLVAVAHFFAFLLSTEMISARILVATDILVTLHDVVIVEILCNHYLLRRETYLFVCRVLLCHDPHCINLCQTNLRRYFLTTLIKSEY